MSTQTIAAFVGYMGVVIAIGIFAARFSSAGVSEFFVGGRRMHRTVVALSAVVSGRSAWLLLGLSGMAWTMGASAMWASVGYIAVELLLFLFYAPRLRRFSERYDCVTLPDFYAARFGDPRSALRLMLAVIILVFMVGYIAAQFVGGGKAFAASFGITPTAGVMITASIVLIYTVLGGFLAVSLTDTVQACFMLFALFALPLVAIIDLGGHQVVTTQLAALDPRLLNPTALAFGTALGFVGIGLGSPGNPHIIVRYMSIRDPAEFRHAAVVGTLANVAMASGAVAIGLVGRAQFPDLALLPDADPETLYPTLAREHFHPVLFGIVLASIFSAIMSTADSQILVAASAVVRDVYERVVRAGEPLSQKRLVLYSRFAVVALVALALVFGLIADRLVFWLVLFAWAGLGAAIGPTSLMALFWRRTTRAGVLAGLAAGSITVVVWYLTPALKGFMYELIPGFAVGLLATILVSRFTDPPRDVDEMMDAMNG